jgi:hypothetical protein
MDDAGRRLTDIDRALAAAIDIAPSPDFVARVRQRVAREPRPLPFWRGWRIAVPALAAVVAVAIGLAVMSRRTPAAPQPLQARALPAIELRPLVADPPRAVTVPASPRRGVPTRLQPAWPEVRTEPEVLVPREEIEMYRRLIAAAQTVPHAVVVESPKDIAAVREISDLAIDPIEIKPIAPPPSGSQGERQ